MSMKCNCGETARTCRSNKGSVYDGAMGTYTRFKRCHGCGESFKTIELRAEELADLRRRAYLYALSQLQEAA